MGKADFTLLRMLVGKILWESLLRALGSASAGHILIITSKEHRNKKFQNVRTQERRAEGWLAE